LEDPGVGGRIILQWIIKKCDGGTDWIDLAEDRNRWCMDLSIMNDYYPLQH
jgi:hypothetical protein